MQDPKTQKPVRQPELPNNRNEEVQKQPANERPIEGQRIQPGDNQRALQNK
jgi:hypothetical protein